MPETGASTSSPAPDHRHHDYKRNKDWRCLGCREWLRTYRPEWATVLDDEQARLNAEKVVRKAERAAKWGRA